jgi:spermidine synthase
MYHIIGTGITVSIFYIISFIFYRTGLYSLAAHKKLWNIILAATFIFTALAGLFMALQINFKWDIPFIKTILRWHVEIGVCLALTGIFHFIWHLSYFGKIFSSSEVKSSNREYKKPASVSIASNLFIVGFAGTAIQFLLIREIMNISGGYELISGIFLGSWLITSASGAAIASRSALNDIRKVNLIFSLSPFLSLFLLLLLSGLFLETGETPSLLVSMIFTFLMLLPFCLVSGFTFIKLVHFARDSENLSPGKSFSIETTGGIAAGILLSALTSGSLNTYKLLLIIVVLLFSYTILTFWLSSPKVKIKVKILLFIVLTIIIVSEPDILFRRILMPGVNVTATKDTPYGNITRGEYSGEESVYYNQRLIAYKNDAIEREEDIHYALLQRTDPEKVLLISGSLEAHLKEVLKYQVKEILFIERDPALTVSLQKESYTGSVHLRIENKDAYRYVRSKGEIFNAAILLLPPPSTLSLNRFYTTDFFLAIKERMSQGGVFMCSPGPGEEYMNGESVKLYSSVFNSLASVFRYVKPVAGNKLYFIASDEDISVDFCALTEKRGIKNDYVNGDYLADDLTESKTEKILSVLDRNIRENRSSFPIACFHFQAYNFSKNISEKIPAIIILILAFVIPVLAVKRRNLIMYCSASALAGFEIIILLTLQLTAGNMYQFTGIILASVMTGLAAGAGINLKLPYSSSIKKKALLLMLYYIIAALSFKYILSVSQPVLSILIIIISSLIPGFMTGHIFRELTASGKGNESGPVYSADLAGSALGFILVSAVILPAFGIQVSVFFLAFLIFAGILFGTNVNK